MTIRRNRFYGGSRPHHVDGFDVDLRVTGHSRGARPRRARRCRLGRTPCRPTYFEPGRNLAAKYGINRSQFFVRPGFVLRHLIFNSARPLFRNNAPLRRAVNFALDRRALARAATNTPLSDRLTDQYLPPSLPGFKDAVDLSPSAAEPRASARAGSREPPREEGRALHEQRSPAPGGGAGGQATAGARSGSRSSSSRSQAPPSSTGCTSPVSRGTSCCFSGPRTSSIRSSSSTCSSTRSSRVTGNVGRFDSATYNRSDAAGRTPARRRALPRVRRARRAACSARRLRLHRSASSTSRHSSRSASVASSYGLRST